MLHARQTIQRVALFAASVAAPLARRFIGADGAILMLHRVTAEPPRALGGNAHLAITPGFLDKLIVALRSDGYAFVSMDEAANRIAGASRGQRFAALTADDAYRDNLLEALPVLERHGAPITIYAAPGLIDGRAFLWWDVLEEAVTRSDRLVTPAGALDCSTLAAKQKAFARLLRFFTTELPERAQREALERIADAAGIDPDGLRRKAIMSWDELAGIANHPLVTIGAHTVHHFNLKRLPAGEALAEMDRSASELEARLGKRPRHFAYPYGYAAAVGECEVTLAAQVGFATAVTTRHGLLRPGHRDHPHALPRISINGRYQDVGHVKTMVSGITTPMANRGRLLVTV